MRRSRNFFVTLHLHRGCYGIHVEEAAGVLLPRQFLRVKQITAIAGYR